MAEITLRGVTKRYPDGTEAVKAIDLDIHDGEFMILVGPSGCGKSTALRMIAGLEEISDGDLIIGGERVNDLAPRDRDIAMVFQNYALYPHMTVRDNMGFALKLAKVDPNEINTKVEEAARILDLEAHLDRKPANLSGGQRQRVAMGRAIVRDPRAFLMDEPLSNLDAKLRVQMRTEVARIQQRVGHDHGLRDARPDRGDDAGRPRGGHARRRDPAGRVAEDALRRPGEPVRRGLHRLSGDELPAGQGRGRHDQAPVRRGPAAEASCAAKVAERQGGHRRHAPRALRGRGRGRRARHRRHEVHGRRRGRGVDGLRALRLLRRQGRGAQPTELDDLAEDAGLIELPGQSGGDATAVVARLDATSHAARRQVESSSCSTRRGSSCSTRTAAAT